MNSCHNYAFASPCCGAKAILGLPDVDRYPVAFYCPFCRSHYQGEARLERGSPPEIKWMDEEPLPEPSE